MTTLTLLLVATLAGFRGPIAPQPATVPVSAQGLRLQPLADGLGWAGAIGRSLESDTLGVFEGRTPCGELALAFTGFPRAHCEKIKWRIVLLGDRRTGQPDSYFFKGTRSSRQGPLTLRRGTATDPTAMVYQFHADIPQGSISFMAVDNNVLLLLDPRLHVMVGDASWSYVLNRTSSPL